MFNFWSHTPSVSLAVKALYRGEVIAYPTEAVWGLGCDPFNPEAVEKVLQLKSRPVDKGLILIAGDISQLGFILKDLSQDQLSKLNDSWPGPVTWLIPNNGSVPYWVTGDHPSVAVRVSNHPFVKALCLTYGGPIISTSANPQGKPAAKTHWQVSRYFRRSPHLSLITQGAVGKRSRPSDIIDLLSGSVMRS